MCSTSVSLDGEDSESSDKVGLSVVVLYMDCKNSESRGDENRCTGCLYVCFTLSIGW